MTMPMTIRKLLAVVPLLLLAPLAPSAQAQAPTVLFHDTFATPSTLAAGTSNGTWYANTQHAIQFGVACAGADLPQCAQISIVSGESGDDMLDLCASGAGDCSSSLNIPATEFYIYYKMRLTSEGWMASSGSGKWIYIKNGGCGGSGPAGCNVCYGNFFVSQSSPFTFNYPPYCDVPDEPRTGNTVLSPGTTFHTLEFHYHSGVIYEIRWDGATVKTFPAIAGDVLKTAVMNWIEPGVYINAETGSTVGSTNILINNFQICTGNWCSAGSGGPAVQFTPSSFNFGSVLTGQTASTTITLQNTGTGPLTWSGFAITADTTDFTLVSTTCVSPLAVSTSCTANVRFNPTSTGAKTAALTLSGSNVAGGTASAALTGTGTQPAPNPVFSPTSVNFGNVNIGGGPSSTITLTNTGSGPLSWTTLATNAAQLFGLEQWPSGTWQDWGGGNPGGGAAPAGGMTLTSSHTTGGAPFAAVVQHVSGTSNIAWAETYFGDLLGAAPQQTDVTYDEDIWFDSNATIGATSGEGTKVNILICNQDWTNTYPQPLSYSPFYLSLVVSGQSSRLHQLVGELHIKTHTPDQFIEWVPNTSSSGVLPFGQWVHVKVRAALNTPGASDGILQIWMNGNLITNYSNVNFRDSYTMRGWNDFQITGFDDAAAPPTMTWNQYWDNELVTSTGGSSEFSLVSTTCHSPLASNASCASQVQFTPVAVGTQTSSLVMSGANFGSGTLTVPLSGTGVAAGPNPSFNPTSLNFGSLTVGTSSPSPSTAVLTNSGAGPFTWTGGPVITSDTTDFTLLSTTCVSPLGPNGNCSMTLQFNPTTTGAKTANVTFTGDNFSGGTLSLPLLGTGAPGPPILVFSPTSFAFGGVPVAQTSSTTFTIQNTGTGPMTWTGFGITVDNTDFTMTSTTCTSPLAAGGSCTATVRFNPASTGAKTGNLSFTGSNVQSQPVTAALTGTGTAPTAAFSPTGFAFGSVNDGTTSSTTITLNNTGTGPLTWSSLAITVDTTSFTLVSTACVSPLAPNGSCASTVRFNPMTAGAKTGGFTLSGANISGGTLNAALTGTGVATAPTLVVTPSSFAFGTVAVGSSAATTLSLQNTGNASLTWTGLAITIDTTNFTLTGTTCVSPLAATASCTANVQFKPTTGGAKSANLEMSGSNFGTGTIDTPLTGTGGTSPNAVFAPSSFNFGSVNDGASAATTLTLSNTGTGALTWTSLSITVDAAEFSLTSTTCVSPLAPASSCNIALKFSPATAGAKSGNLALGGSNFGSGTVNVSLTGTGVATGPNLVITPTSFAFGSVNVGSNTSTTIAFQNKGNGNLTWSGLAITGDTVNYSLTSTTCSSPLAPAGSCTATVKFAPTVTGGLTAALTMSGSNFGSGGVTNVTFTGVGGTPSGSQPGITIASLTKRRVFFFESIACAYTDTNKPGTVSTWKLSDGATLRKTGTCSTRMCNASYFGLYNSATPHCAVTDSLGYSGAK